MISKLAGIPVCSVNFLLILCLILPGKMLVIGQDMPFPPPNHMQVFNIQDLNFGTFATGNNGGSVILSPEGMRSSTGSVILMGGDFNQAVFEIKLVPGRLVQIEMGPEIQLTRTGGGGSMNMKVGPADLGSSFITHATHPFFFFFYDGGTLFIGSGGLNPPGEYEGLFNVTFIQE